MTNLSQRRTKNREKSKSGTSRFATSPDVVVLTWVIFHDLYLLDLMLLDYGILKNVCQPILQLDIIFNFQRKVPLTHKKNDRKFGRFVFCVSNCYLLCLNLSLVHLRFVVYTLERLLYFQIYLSYATSIIFGIPDTTEILRLSFVYRRFVFCDEEIKLICLPFLSSLL